MIYKQSQFIELKERLEQYIPELKHRIRTLTIKNNWTLNKRRLLPLSWVVSIIAVAALTLSLQNESTYFFGIADNSEQTISFSYPVQIVQNLVIEGSEVKQGQRLARIGLKSLVEQGKGLVGGATLFHEHGAAGSEHVSSSLFVCGGGVEHGGSVSELAG